MELLAAEERADEEKRAHDPAFLAREALKAERAADHLLEMEALHAQRNRKRTLVEEGNSEDVAALKAEIEALSMQVEQREQDFKDEHGTKDEDAPSAAAAAAAGRMTEADAQTDTLAKAAQLLQSAEEGEAGKRAENDAAQVLKLRLEAQADNRAAAAAGAGADPGSVVFGSDGKPIPAVQIALAKAEAKAAALAAAEAVRRAGVPFWCTSFGVANRPSVEWDISPPL